MGAWLNRFSFSGISADTYCNGEVLLNFRGEPRPIKFVLVGMGDAAYLKAENVYMSSFWFCHGRIPHPLMFVHYDKVVPCW
ncbi:hypothetical protein ACE6H2_017666 [Prunus campanulata]